MSNKFLQQVQAKIKKVGKTLEEMDSTILEELSAELTTAKMIILKDYSEAQKKVQSLIYPAQLREKGERDKDPEYAKLHQGVGVQYTQTKNPPPERK